MKFIYILLGVISLSSGVSHADDIRIVPELANGVSIYKPVNIKWQDTLWNKDNNYVKAALMTIDVRNCEQRNIPLRVVYKSEKAKSSFSGYYQIDSKLNSEIKLTILNNRLESGTIFDHVEVDSTYAKCLGDAKISRLSESPFPFILKVKTEKTPEHAWSSAEQNQGDPIVFGTLYSDHISRGDDASYHFKGLVVPRGEIRSVQDWFRIGDPVSMNSKFEKNILGRPIVCAVINELADVDRYPLKSGDSIRMMGKVAAGSAFLTISRVGGGVVKIALLNRGVFADEFRASMDGDYSISLSSNVSVYNYPYLDFELSLRHVK